MELDVNIEVAPCARGVCGPPYAQRASVNVGDQENIGERVTLGGERRASRVALHGPLELSRLTCPPERPDVMQLERIRVDDHEAVASLPLESVLPPGAPSRCRRRPR